MLSALHQYTCAHGYRIQQRRAECLQLFMRPINHAPRPASTMHLAERIVTPYLVSQQVQ